MTQSIQNSERERDNLEALRQNIVRIRERKPRMLIVDDNDNDAMLLRKQIESECVPCEIEISASCEDALARIRQRQYDVVFLDLRFPGMSGVALLQAVGDETERIPFLCFSGLEEGAEELHGAMNNGAFGLYRKPFSNLQVKSICGLVNA